MTIVDGATIAETSQRCQMVSIAVRKDIEDCYTPGEGHMQNFAERLICTPVSRCRPQPRRPKPFSTDTQRVPVDREKARNDDMNTFPHKDRSLENDLPPHWKPA